MGSHKIMSIFKWCNEKIKQFSWVDVKIIGIIGMCFGIILIKIFPSIATWNIWWFIAILVLGYLKVGFTFFKKK